MAHEGFGFAECLASCYFSPMNKEAKIDQHERDFVGWAFDQAERLRALPHLNNAGLDIENLAEEIEDLGRSEINKIHSLIRQALVHLIKIVADPEADARRHWQQEIGGFVVPIRRAWSPGYRQRIDMDEIWADAREEAGNALEAYDVRLPELPDSCPFPIDTFVEPGFDTSAAIEQMHLAVRGQDHRPESKFRSAESIGR